MVLIGHSQGAGILSALIRRRIDGAPDQRRLVSAILAGNFVHVPTGRDVGGTFKSIPACRRAAQVGCVIVFNTYRSDHPVPEKDLIAPPPGLEPLCVNPAALGGGRAALDPYLSATGETILPDLTGPQEPWTTPPVAPDAPFVAEPGRFLAACRHDAHGVYLAVDTRPRGGDRRTGDVAGDWMVGGQPEATMGLHLIDLNLVMGDLIAIVGDQARAYLARPRD